MRNLITIMLSLAMMIAISGEACAQKLTKEERKAAKEAEAAAIKSAIEANNFNIVLTKTVPRNGSSEVYYPDGRFVIRVRGDHAETFIPGVTTLGYMEFGGGEAVGEVEPVQFTCELKSRKKVISTYTLTSERGTNYEITIRASENASADITVVRKPTGLFKFIGEVVVPTNN